MLHHARRTLEKLGIRPGSGVFTAIQSMKSILVDPLRRRAMARRGRRQESFPPFPVHVIAAWNSLLAKHGLAGLGTATEHSERIANHETALGLWILCRLLELPDHRKRFPKALSDGPQGTFCTWLKCEPLPAGIHAELIEAYFAGRPGDRVLRYIDDKEWVLRTLPLALTPAGRHGILDWLLGTTVKHLGELDQAETIWFALERAEDSSFGFGPTWLRLPAWQAHWPLALTAVGADSFLRDLKKRHPALNNLLPAGNLGLDKILPVEDQARLVAAEYCGHGLPNGDTGANGHEPKWLGQLEHTKPGDPALSNLIDRVRAEKELDGGWRPGFNVLGHCSYWSGVGEAQRMLREAVDAAGGRTATRDVPADWRFDQPTRPDYLGVESYDTSILCIPLFTRGDRIHPRAGLNRKPGVRKIAYWYWELEVLPKNHAKNARHFDEIWAPTQFVAGAVRAAVPDKPVRVVLPAVQLGKMAAVERAKYGLAETDFVAMFMFDVASVLERKNPLAVVEAFRKAFGNRRDTRLVLKISRPEFDPQGVKQLREAVAKVNGIIIDQHVSRAEAYGIMNMCDCYISLHRSEGYGITLAEAMLLGKPVIATGYSGNMDFMSGEFSMLVPYKLTTISQNLPYYPKGCRWAEADVDEAAQHLRWAYDHPALARRMGDKARIETARILSMESYGKRALEQVMASREGRSPEHQSALKQPAAA